MAHLREAGLAPQLWLDVTPNPKDHEIEAGFARYVEAGCDVVLGIGGGSVMDAAKGVALLAANDGSILDNEGIEHRIPPLIMLPSTSGTGADVSPSSASSPTPSGTPRSRSCAGRSCRTSR